MSDHKTVAVLPVEGKLEDNCVGIPLVPKLKKSKNTYFNASSSVACLKDGEWYFSLSFAEIRVPHEAVKVPHEGRKIPQKRKEYHPTGL